MQVTGGCKDGTERFCVAFPRFLPVVTSYMIQYNIKTRRLTFVQSVSFYHV